MKIRRGFVSNSSSTSFAVHQDKFPTVRDLAIEMMNIRNEDDICDDGYIAHLTTQHTETQDEKLFEQIKEIIDLRTRAHEELCALENSTLDKDTPTAFSTTNYNTYILKSGSFLLVSTSSNYYWDIPTGIIKNWNNINNEDFDTMDDIEYSLKYASDFWWPKINKTIKQFENIDKKCKCHSDMVWCDGVFVCPKCDLKMGDIT